MHSQHPNTLPLCLLCIQLVIGDSPLTLNLKNLVVSGTFQLGTSQCPVKSQITVNIPGGDETYGIDVLQGATYDVSAYTQVLGSGGGCNRVPDLCSMLPAASASHASKC